MDRPPIELACGELEALGDLDGNVQVSEDGRTVWVHGNDGSTVGRFSKVFGMDVHRTVKAQLAGEPQCLQCTHEKPGREDWERFCDLMESEFGIQVPRDAIQFE